MSLPRTLKFFAVLIWALLLAFPSQADINPRNTGKSTEQQVSQPENQEQSQTEEVRQEQVNDEVEESEPQKLKSNSSLNYIFYMIYKVKFENLFRLPDRSSTQSSAGLRLININTLIEYLNDPKI